MKKVFVACPHCGNSFSTEHGFSGSGSTRKSCPKCHKGVNIRIKNGELDSVTK
jgi:hypothetical protein